ncbi:MAG: S-methyl-5'-thioadenosine phosphorylase [Acidimicrobiales bacterium]
MQEVARIAVVGGSGLYSLGTTVEELSPHTPYGRPSDAICLTRVGEELVAFLPRHGRGHTIPPHQINYRANLFALSSLGVERVIGPCAVGSLRPALEPGTVVVCDQFVDRTRGRLDTFFDGPKVAHLSAADPYCAELRPLASAAAKQAGFEVADGGTVVVIQGPRFSTRAESQWFQQMGADVVGMTQYPEVVLARELGMCYVTLAVVTDFDAGLAGRPDVAPVTHEEVIAAFARSREQLVQALQSLLTSIPEKRGCDCRTALEPV